MLNDLSRATLVLAIDAEQQLTVVKNARGPRMREDGLKQLALQLSPADRRALLSEWIRLGHIPPGSRSILHSSEVEA